MQPARRIRYGIALVLGGTALAGLLSTALLPFHNPFRSITTIVSIALFVLATIVLITKPRS